MAERFADAHGVLSDGLRHAQTSGSSYAYAACSMFRCETNYRRGELTEAEADGVAGLELMKEVGSYWGELVALVFLVPCLLERGKLDEAAELVDSAGMDGELPPAFIFSGVA